MQDTIADQMINFTIKATLIVTAWIYAQVDTITELSIEKAFDQMFSIGLLVVFLIYMYTETRRKGIQRDEAYKENMELLKANIEAMNAITSAISQLKESIDRIDSRISN